MASTIPFHDAYADFHDDALKYDFITEISPKIWKISRKSDRMEFLAHDITNEIYTDVPGTAFMMRGALGNLLSIDGESLEEQIKAILKHPNLMSFVESFAMEITYEGQRGYQYAFTVWDYCDAGNLGNLLIPSQPRPQDRDASPDIKPEDDDTEMKDASGESEKQESSKFLPESFCWHVLTSVLRALAWLHDGVHDLIQKENGAWQRLGGEVDWQPMLHRDISPQNIFLSHPRRREWYGPVKLGNYGRLFVSGHCQPFGDKQMPTSSKVLAPPPDKEFTPLQDLIAFDTKHGSLYPRQPNQPYTMVSEYRALGEIIQAMMVEPTCSQHVKMIQAQPARVNLQDLNYTGRLKNFVVKLMEFDPWHKAAGKREPNPLHATTELYREALLGVQWFMDTGNDEADNLVTPQMAEYEDFLDNSKLAGDQLFDSFKNVQEILEQFK
ncbi:hypothetical protein GQX73_g2585 [Xylaria multiplex]|uniref:EKC/KEOPS complex subunit BUD32 n=1 Tax=Xylaria multiplex TaxID=323545 RepID=A0A7C8IVF7_9PEZI|nr:hypothetical protein GQX73_g2585 [Xylaria multiplex]